MPENARLFFAINPMITSLLAGRALSGKNKIKVISRVYYAAGNFYLKK